MNRLLAFYYGGHPDNRGRMLAEILRQDDLYLELAHDFIQWLFPLSKPSSVNPAAPLIDRETRDAFLSDELLREHMRTAFVRMLAFLGLEFSGEQVGIGANWSMRKSAWFTESGHNSARITRILASMSSLGLRKDANAFLSALLHLCETEPDCAIDERARRYWREAVLVPAPQNKRRRGSRP